MRLLGTSPAPSSRFPHPRPLFSFSLSVVLSVCLLVISLSFLCRRLEWLNTGPSSGSLLVLASRPSTRMLPCWVDPGLLHHCHAPLPNVIPTPGPFLVHDPHSYNDCDPSPGYVIPDRSDDCWIPPLPCDLQVGELVPSRRHMSTSLAASNGPVGEDDNPYSNVAIDEASVLVEALQNHTRTSSMLPNLTNASYLLHPVSGLGGGQCRASNHSALSFHT